MPKLPVKTALFYLILLDFVLLTLFAFVKSRKTAMFLFPTGDTVQVINPFIKVTPNKTVYGYLPYWVLNNSSNIEYDKLTDVAFFGLNVDRQGNFIKYDSDGNLEPGFNAWKNNKDLKKIIKNAKLWKVRFALTLVAQDKENIEGFLNCGSCWDTLLSNTIKELKNNNIKDVNLDFEQATQTDPQTSKKYTEFVEFINEGLDKTFDDSKVIVAAFADSYIRERITNPTQLAKVSDGIFIMAYDFHQPTSETAGPVAPLGGANKNYEYDIQSSIRDFKKNVSPFKLILGMPYYGYNFLIQDAKPYSRRVTGNDVRGYSVSQYYSTIMENGNIPLDEIQWDEDSKTPFIIYTSNETGALRVLHFENALSIREKLKFSLSENLLGVGIWALGYDGNRKELWREINEVLKNSDLSVK